MAIYYKNGYVDTRHIVKVYNTKYSGVSVVLLNQDTDDYESKYEHKPILDFCSCWDVRDPIVQTGASQELISSIDYIDVDATLDEVNDYVKFIANQQFEAIKENHSVYSIIEQYGGNLGIVCEIFKGRKYKVGTRFTPKFAREYSIAGTYGHGVISYLIGSGVDEFNQMETIKVNPDNCRIVDWGTLYDAIRKECEKSIQCGASLIDGYDLWRVFRANNKE